MLSAVHLTAPAAVQVLLTAAGAYKQQGTGLAVGRNPICLPTGQHGVQWKARLQPAACKAQPLSNLHAQDTGMAGVWLCIREQGCRSGHRLQAELRLLHLTQVCSGLTVQQAAS